LFCGIPTHDRKDIKFFSFYEFKIKKITYIFISLLYILWKQYGAHYSIYLYQYFRIGCFLLFCFVLFVALRSQDYTSPSHILGTVKKTLMRKGARALFHGIPTHGVKVMDFWIIFEFRKLENYFYFWFACGNDIWHTSPYIKLAWIFFTIFIIFRYLIVLFIKVRSPELSILQ